MKQYLTLALQQTTPYGAWWCSPKVMTHDSDCTVVIKIYTDSYFITDHFLETLRKFRWFHILLTLPRQIVILSLPAKNTSGGASALQMGYKLILI